jgi:uncharacterized MAPEG superfamily protein
MTAVFSIAILSSAFLLFLIEPLVAKMLLPYYGGAPAVWNTCMIFFQAMLLLGYCYSHLLSKKIGLRAQVIVHLVISILPLVFLPIGFDESAAPPSDAEPAYWLLWVLTLNVGLPFFALASVSPILQKWFSGLNHRLSDDPYFLYAASNAGSFLALLSYPLVCERLWTSQELSGLWRYGYLVSVVLIFLCSLVAYQRRAAVSAVPRVALDGAAAGAGAPLSFRTALFWVFAAFVPSALMLAVTNHITTNVAAVPLLWVLPLCLYLLTFVMSFARKPPVSLEKVRRLLPFVVLPCMLLLFISIKLELLMVPVHLALFLVVALACHGELADKRPAKERLTDYYLLISLGGALGGIFVAIVSPMVFKTIVEYPVSLFLALIVMTRFEINRMAKGGTAGDIIAPAALAVGLVLVVAASRWVDIENGSLIQVLVIFVPSALIVFSFRERPWRFALAYGVVLAALWFTIKAGDENRIYQGRNFFGAKHISENPEKKVRYLYHGTTLHGAQYIEESRQTEPLTYFTRKGPLGDVFEVLYRQGYDLRIGVIGLGAGTIASYVRKGSRITFYEIDGDILELAGNGRYFSYLDRMEGDGEIVIGDGRLKLKETADKTYDAIIVDAFSSDAIPVHLLTQEAFALYKSKTKDDGTLVFHISNRFLDLRPVLAGNADHLGLECMEKFDRVSTSGDDPLRHASHYAVLSPEGSAAKQFLTQERGWGLLGPDRRTTLWTDRYSNILGLLKLKDAFGRRP